MLKKTFNFFVWSITFCAILGVLAGISGVVYVFWQVKYGDYTQLKKTTILAMFQEETSLFYEDGKTRIGSIFESTHRRYVPVNEIPAHMINAVVAVEDKNFYHHIGIDPLAIGSALAEGVSKRGQFRRGGSTITQQTVKNILNDWEPSFFRKFREMIRALQLERIYDKRQILEFYLNQFHVVGTGNGLDIAARYYFDKEVKDLTLNESAFIAGSVKGPGKYNPFIKFTKIDREQAITNANDRKNYVLAQMLDQAWISREEYEAAVKTPVPFKKGEFRTVEVSLVDLVQAQLVKKEILEALGITNPEDISIAGLKVFTTIDADLQRIAQLSMRRNLSRLETILSGFEPEAQDNFKVLRDLKVDEFVYGKVSEVPSTTLQHASVKITFEGGPRGTIPTESLIRYAKTLNLVDGKGYEHYFQQLMSKIKAGEILYVEVMSFNKETNEAVLELHKRPIVSGGLIALDKGEVRAIVSGFDTLGYNRAVSAKRQAGSVFKSEVYFAALQLGWSVLDRLDNTRQIFPYQSRYYFPRPDHKSPYESVSMLWAGVLSENLASVSLTAHLLDKLNFDQFKQLLATMKLDPVAGEAPRDFHYRVAKATGVSLDDEGVESFQVNNAINDLAPDLVFGGDDSLLKKLKQMWWGNGYIEEMKRVHAGSGEEYNHREKKIRIDLLANNYLRLKALNIALSYDLVALQTLLEKAGGATQLWNDPAARNILSKFRIVNDQLNLAYVTRLSDEDSIVSTESVPFLNMVGRTLEAKDLEALLKPNADNTPASFKQLADNVWVDGIVPSRILNRMKDLISQKLADIRTRQQEDPYRLYSYFQHHDFRIGLGLNYLVKLSHAGGVQNKMEAVLSFPLGANDVTTSEVAKIYQTFTNGKVYRFYEDGPSNQLSFIKRIEDRFGNVLYQAERKESVLVPPSVAQQTREILRRVITHGTGRRARGELYINVSDKSAEAKGGVRQVRVPSFGKTGTTNDFKTSYFAGFMPYPTAKGKPLSPENSYTVATYVGYDMNKIMRKGSQSIHGSKGALPIWTDFLKDVIEVKKYADYLDPNVKTEWPMVPDEKTVPFLVELPSGAVLRAGAGADESWKSTNIAVTGEEYLNYYDPLDTPNSSTLNLPSDPLRRSFSLFQFPNSPKDEFVN